MPSFISRIEDLFHDWLTPLVNSEYILLLFVTFIFHRHYFEAASSIDKLVSFMGNYAVVFYIYGAIVLFVNLIKVSDEWRDFTAFLLFLGGELILLGYSSFFWMHPLELSWLELLMQLWYVAQALISLILIVLLVTQPKGSWVWIAPRLEYVPGLFKSLAISGYIVGATLILENIFHWNADDITWQVTFWGIISLEVLQRLQKGFISPFGAGR